MARPLAARLHLLDLLGKVLLDSILLFAVHLSNFFVSSDLLLNVSVLFLNHINI